MSHFAFYYGAELEIQTKFRNVVGSMLREPNEILCGNFVLLHENPDSRTAVLAEENLVGALRGYVHWDETRRNDGQTDVETFFHEVARAHCWPLRGSTTGCFAAVGYCLESDQLVLCNDLIGYLPLYFSKMGEGIIGGSRLVDIGRLLGAKPDAAGIIERLTPPFVNYGSRTILRGVRRLLPGQCVRFSESGSRESSQFDNTLFGEVLTESIDSTAERVWACLCSETLAASSGVDNLTVALSGGWDSRHILAAVAGTKPLRCCTYGNEEHYEVKIARKCADAVGAQLTTCSLDDKCFPRRSKFQTLVRETESANHLQWIPIINEVAKAGIINGTILVGDMCETIQGRGMLSISSREARMRIFLEQMAGINRPMGKCTSDQFARWKQSKREALLGKVRQHQHLLSSALREEVGEDDLLRSVEEDIECSFSRIEANLPPFAVLLDELFHWFHKARLFMATQCLLLEDRYRVVCPPMAMQFMRLISCVSPEMREQRRLLTAIGRLSGFDALAGIPSAQIPWVGVRSPLALRLAIWGFRSKCDQWLATRAMRKQDNSARQRLLPSMDWISEYRRESTLPNVENWFTNKWILGGHYVQLAQRRASLQSWPYVNADIASAANLSILLDLSVADVSET